MNNKDAMTIQEHTISVLLFTDAPITVKGNGQIQKVTEILVFYISDIQVDSLILT